MNYDYDNYQWQPGMPDPMEGMDDDERIAASITQEWCFLFNSL